jgi:hypothetical protein
MKKTLLFFILILFSLIHRFYFDQFKFQSNHWSHSLNKEPIFFPSHPTEIPKTWISNSRSPAQDSRIKKVSLKNLFKTNKDIKLGKSYVLTDNIAAIGNKEYSSHLGPLIEQDKNWSYFKNLSGHPQIPVVYSSSKNKFYPVSKVIQIHQVTPELKDQLLAEGFKEFHYSKSLKLLFVESHSDEILQTYLELKERGLRADLEILGESYRKH